MRVQTTAGLWSIGVGLVAIASLAGCNGNVIPGSGTSTAGDGGSATTSAGGGGAGGNTGVAGQGTGGDLFTSTTVPPGSFACGDTSCDGATQYCIKALPGPCCGPASYSCEPLPAECQSAADACACILASECPCGPGSCGTPGIGVDCDGSGGGPVMTCGYP